VAEHHVGELVVTVDDARLPLAGLVTAEPVGGHLQSGDVPEPDRIEVGHPPGDLAVVEAVGLAESLEADGLPVHPGQPGDTVDQLDGQPRARLEVGVERGGPLVPHAHGRPAVHQAHEVEGRPDHRVVAAGGVGLGMRHVGAVQGMQHPVLAQHGLVAALRDHTGRPAQHGAEVAPADLEDLVGRTPTDER